MNKISLGLLLAASLFGANFSFAESVIDATKPIHVDSFQFGHNLSATSATLGAGQCVLGVQIMGCGVTNRLTIGSSPWLFRDYKMWNIGGRYLLKEEVDGRWTVQAHYIKSFTPRNLQASGERDYEMEALWLIWVRTIEFDDRYKLHLNLQTNYYADEKMPFSLRRPHIQPNPFQINISALNELELYANWFALVELGLVDLFNRPMAGHGGFSVGKRIGHFSFHLGFSATGTQDGFFSPIHRGDYQQALRWQANEGYKSNLDPNSIKYDFSIHPEFTLQYLF